MRIAFTRNERSTIGVELEVHVVDARSGDLVPAATELLAEMGRRHGSGEHPNVKHELFESTIEIVTGVCDNPDEAWRDLRQTFDELNEVARDRGLRIMSAGTHPFALARQQVVSPDPRYHDLVENLQWPARRLLICGTHVHVGVRSGAASIAIVNEIRRWLPVFLALSVSSPYFEGEDSGLASARTKIFEGLPTAGLPPVLDDWSDFETFMDTLIRSACISSVREVWWDVRPHPDFGTVEFRMCDAVQTLDEAAVLAALAQSLVAWASWSLETGALPTPPREWTIRENKWLASRYGLAAELIVEGPDGPARRPITEVIDDLVTLVEQSAEMVGARPWLDRLPDLLAHGAGSDRQRRIVAAGGTLPEVVMALADELESGLLLHR